MDDLELESICYYEYKNGNMCAALTAGDACDQCGAPLCPMHAEGGAGFCNKHPDVDYIPWEEEAEPEPPKKPSKLSPPQRRVIELMQDNLNINWWSLPELNCHRRTVEALERRGYVKIFYDSVSGDRWKLTPESERRPQPDLDDIPF